MKSLTQHINEHLITESKQGFSAEDFWFAMDEYFDYEVDREDIGSTYISGNKIEFQAESKKYKDAALEILKKKTKSVKSDGLNVKWNPKKSDIINESAKYSDKLVQAAISYSTGKDFDTIYEISDESKGYSYKVKGKSGYSTVSYSDINDIIDNHKDSLKKKFSLVNESAKQTLWDWFDQNIDDFKSASAYLKAGQKVGFKKEDLMSISDDFEQYSEKEFESDKVKKEYSMLSK